MTVFALKLLAVLSMFVDHLGAEIFVHELWMRHFGRLAFPIYAFLISEGFRHTRNLRAYLSRLFVFAIVSEVPFDLYFSGYFPDFGHQNVYFTLFLGLFALYVIVESNSGFLKAVALVGICLIAQGFHTDYRYPGVLLIVCFYYLKDFELLKCLSAICINIRLFPAYVQATGCLALLPIYLYNGKKGLKWRFFFYAFYPLHLILLYGIKQCFLEGGVSS